MEENTFDKKVKESWGQTENIGMEFEDIKIKTKFKRLKQDLKVWWDMLKISKGQEKKALQVKMLDLDVKIDNGFATEEEKKNHLSIKEALYRFDKKSHGFTSKSKNYMEHRGR